MLIIISSRLAHHSPHLTSPHLTSPHLTSPHLTSPHLTSPHLTSPHPTPPHPTPPHLTSIISHFPLTTHTPPLMYKEISSTLVPSPAKKIIVARKVHLGDTSFPSSLPPLTKADSTFNQTIIHTNGLPITHTIAPPFEQSDTTIPLSIVSIRHLIFPPSSYPPFNSPFPNFFVFYWVGIDITGEERT